MQLNGGLDWKVVMTKREKLLRRVRREHDLAVNALGRRGKVQPGTTTHSKHHSDFVRHEELFDIALEALHYNPEFAEIE
jgi:hypothetical protein|tara:strand:- start:3431 stop:3667 length:237 start_codon:yes stop_codon:yes gene_type:complete